MPSFLIDSFTFQPGYLKLGAAELRRRADAARARLVACRACPRDCGIDRLADRRGVCQTGRYARVSCFFAHLGEENCLRGWRGSGTLFFAGCNLRCVFCQNWETSQIGEGSEVQPGPLAEMMLKLQAQGCHNLNLVTPEHVVPQILEALPSAIPRGLKLPIVYNTSGYDAPESLELLDGIVDIYMPDFKVWDPILALRYLRAKDYPAAARRAIREMHRQVGALKFDEQGLAKRGVLVRHLVMPGGIAGTEAVMRFLAEEVSPDTYVNLMAQYRPAGRVNSERYAELDRHITREEYAQAMRAARGAGLWRFDRL